MLVTDYFFSHFAGGGTRTPDSDFTFSLSVASVAALGRSFGIAPADRGLVASGPYRVVRHPLYLGELVFYAGVCVARPSVLHITLWAALACVQVARLRAEERSINRYGEYAQVVPWRLAPGLW